MKVLALSNSGNLCGIVSSLSRTGAEVKQYVASDIRGQLLRGMVTPVNSWRSEIDWADIVLLDDVSFWRSERLWAVSNTPVFNYARGIIDIYRSRTRLIHEIEGAVMPWASSKYVTYSFPIAMQGMLPCVLRRSRDKELYRYQLLGLDDVVVVELLEKMRGVLNTLALGGYFGMFNVKVLRRKSEDTLTQIVDICDPTPYDMIEALSTLTNTSVQNFLGAMLSTQDTGYPYLEPFLNGVCYGAALRCDNMAQAPEAIAFLVGAQVGENQQVSWLQNEVAARFYTGEPNRESLRNAVNTGAIGHA